MTRVSRSQKNSKRRQSARIGGTLRIARKASLKPSTTLNYAKALLVLEAKLQQVLAPKPSFQRPPRTSVDELNALSDDIAAARAEAHVHGEGCAHE